MGGTPQKTTQQLKNEKDISRIKVIKDSTKPKYIFEYNTLKSGLTGQPNTNPEIASSILNRAMKSKLARNKVENKKNEVASTLLNKAMRSHIARKDYKAAQETYDPYIHQENIRAKRKQFERILTNKRTKPQVKIDTQKKYDKTNYLFKRRSNAGRPPINPYTGVKQIDIQIKMFKFFF